MHQAIKEVHEFLFDILYLKEDINHLIVVPISVTSGFPSIKDKFFQNQMIVIATNRPSINYFFR